MQVIYTSSFLHVCYYHEQHALETRWLGMTINPEMQEALLETVRFAHTHQVKHWISNQQKMQTFRPSDREWVKAYFLPRIQLLSLDSTFVILSSNILTQLGVYDITQALSETIMKQGALRQ